LLKFARDQRRWLQWLFEAKKRFGTTILNYSVTSNHIHLVIRDDKGQEVIPQTMQLVAGRTGQEYNLRKNRKGAFWEDRYHATAVQADSHLVQCMVYIDLNMVRAGVVPHPSEWPFCGYHEILNTRQRYTPLLHKDAVESTAYPYKKAISTLLPPAQAPPQLPARRVLQLGERGFCPGGRASWPGGRIPSPVE